MREIVNGIFYVMRAGRPWRLLGEADLVGIFAHDFDGDQRGRGDLLPGISAVGEDASGRGCISAIVTHILNKSDALQFAAGLQPNGSDRSRPCENSTRYNRTRNFEACGHAQSKNMQKFLLRLAIQPN
jgi:hypothetical protein